MLELFLRYLLGKTNVPTEEGGLVMSQGLAIMLVCFVGLLCLRVPIAFVLGLVTLIAAEAFGYTNIPLSLASDLGNGIDNFALLAIPFFILAGS